MQVSLLTQAQGAPLLAARSEASGAAAVSAPPATSTIAEESRPPALTGFGQRLADPRAVEQAEAQPSEGEETNAQGLTEAEQEEVAQLRKRDREVRAHEQAHARAGGPYASAPQYEFVRGPDGKFYAVDGHVDIDTSEESSPEATIAKMEVVIRAALAPANPSPEDRQVAAEAKRKLLEAQRELAEKKEQEEIEAGRQRQQRQAELRGDVPPDRAAGSYAAIGAVLAGAAEAQQTATQAFSVSA